MAKAVEQGLVQRMIGESALRFQQQDGLTIDDAAVMTQSLDFARFYEAARQACGAPKLVANWLMGEVSKRLNTEDRDIADAPVSPATLAALINRIQDGTVSNNAERFSIFPCPYK